MPLCIAGMHRSGTSMIANILYHCGLDLGPRDDMLRPAACNPEGFWESRSFVKINDAVLKALGGKWHRPPRTDFADWRRESVVQSFAKQVRQLTLRFHGCEPWGWKDPRNCLTLPFWRNLIPELKVLICVRNPLAVAESLHARDGHSHADALKLWLTYNRRILDATSPSERLVTHCERYLLDPRGELRRVLAWLGLDASEKCLDDACSRIRPSLLHHRPTLDQLIEASVSDELLSCYENLCVEAEAEEAIFAAPRS